MHEAKRMFASVAGLLCSAVTLSLIWIPLAMGVSAHAQTSEQQAGQQPKQSTAVVAPVIPQQVQYAGKLATRSGETVDAVFSLYAAKEGGEPLWTETQQAKVGADGSYTVLLGGASPAGLPQSLFAGGAARWLGVSVEQAPELERVLLSSAPYAMKSADAESLAGHPASDFVTQEQLAQLSQSSALSGQNSAEASNTGSSGPVSGLGTIGTVPLWTGANLLGNSDITQVGGEIGIDTATPGASLDVNGTGNFRGTLTLPALATATTSAGQRSQVMAWNTSAWSTTASAAVTPIFKLYASPVGNNTATPSANLYFLYQMGNIETNILSVASNGVMTFAPAQTFPGTIMSVGNQSITGGLTVTGLSSAGAGFLSNGAVTVKPASVATSTTAVNSPLLELGASAYSSGSASAVAQNFAWQVLPTGNNTATPSSNLALLFGSGTTTPASTGFSISPKGLINWASGQTFPITGTGGGTITGITTSSPLTGSGTSGSVALGLNQSALVTNITPSLETTFDSRYALLSAGDIFSKYLEAYQTSGPGNAAVLGWGTNGSVGTFGDSDTGFGLQGESTSGHGVYAQVTTPAAGSSGVLGFTGSAFSASYSSEAGIANAGIWADNSKAGTGVPVSLFATGDDTYGGVFLTNGADYPALFVDNNGGTAGQFEASTGYGLSASTSSGTGVYGSTSSGGNGVEGFNSATAQLEAGVFGEANSLSATGSAYNVYAGVWGDTGVSSTTVAPAWAIGVLGTADDGHAGVFLNNSSGWSTIYVSNSSAGGTGNSVGAGTGNSTSLFKTLMASSADGTCGIGGGSMTCTGPIKSLASAGNGARTVETYGVQSPENWMEDFGTGQLENGAAVVRIDSTFAETVSGTADYHVFLTPRADSKGLYVTNETPTSFEVRESGGGASSLSFDYRIVARRRGYEALRHVDVTQGYRAEMMAASIARGSGVARRPAAMAKSPLQAALGSHSRLLVPARSPTPHKTMSRPANTTTHP